MAAADTTRLEVALTQLAGLIGNVSEANAGEPTPCTDWTVAQLVDHIVHGTANFARVARGEQVDWSAPSPTIDGDRAAAFETAAAALTDAWKDPVEGASPDMPCAELGVHTWDLATALGVGAATLDRRVADVGYALMQANLTDDARGDVFAPATSAPEDADAYTRLAAFAGRAM